MICVPKTWGLIKKSIIMMLLFRNMSRQIPPGYRAECSRSSLSRNHKYFPSSLLPWHGSAPGCSSLQVSSGQVGGRDHLDDPLIWVLEESKLVGLCRGVIPRRNAACTMKTRRMVERSRLGRVPVKSLFSVCWGAVMVRSCLGRLLMLTEEGLECRTRVLNHDQGEEYLLTVRNLVLH